MSYYSSAPTYPQQQGFQPLAPQASGAPFPTYMPGQPFQQQPYGSAGAYPQQYPQQQYSQQQFSQQYPQQNQLSQTYGVAQQYNPQASYTGQQYNPQAPLGYSASGYAQTGTWSAYATLFQPVVAHDVKKVDHNWYLLLLQVVPTLLEALTQAVH